MKREDWQVAWKWFRITVIVPVLIGITIESLHATYMQRFGQMARK